jgi:hypothetical protein
MEPRPPGGKVGYPPILSRDLTAAETVRRSSNIMSVITAINLSRRKRELYLELTNDVDTILFSPRYSGEE